MSTRARATVAAGCAALTMAAVAAATPAGAAADARYDCGVLPFPSTIHFARDASDRLVLQTNLSKALFSSMPITVTLDGGHSITDSPLVTSPYPLSLRGIYPWRVSAAPSQIVFAQYQGPTYTCELITATAGFPV